MNILIIARGTPSKCDPQWGSFEFDQARALVELGHHVSIASVDTRFRFYWRTLGLTIENKSKIRTYNYFCCPLAIIGLLGKRLKELILKWQWKQIESAILKENVHYDIIYSHYLFNSYNAIQWLTRLNAPVVAIEHWSALNQNPLPHEVEQMAKYTYSHVTKLLTVSHQLQKRISELFNAHSEVVNNMISPQYTYEKKVTPSICSFISVGSLRPLKGFDTLIKAFTIANLPKGEWALQIVGSGEEMLHIQQLIHQYQLSDYVQLLGQKNAQDIASLLNRSNAFILASRSETFGVVYIEAMACGLPVIATQCGGPEEFVTDKNGLLVPVDNVEKLAEAIKYMFHYYQEYNRQAIANDCQARFSSEVIAKQLTEIFEDVVAKFHRNTTN